MDWCCWREAGLRACIRLAPGKHCGIGDCRGCVVGTSVGAMNGALVALGLYDEAEALWKKHVH